MPTDGSNLEKAATDVAVEVAKDAYKDLLHPILEPTGKICGLLPRLVLSALLPLNKWILYKECSLEKTINILAEKLNNVPPNNIVSPEPHIAVPALIAISYSMDNDEIRNMYANLLAASMNKIVKNNVHPAFVEIIKQLCPDEAKLLYRIKNANRLFPLIDFNWVMGGESGETTVIRNFSFFPKAVPTMEYKDHSKVSAYIDNIERLKLIEIPEGKFTTPTDIYEQLMKESPMQEKINEYKSKKIGYRIEKKCGKITDFGKLFCQICIE